jgi:hypothetical protein
MLLSDGVPDKVALLLPLLVRDNQFGIVVVENVTVCPSASEAFIL